MLASRFQATNLVIHRALQNVISSITELLSSVHVAVYPIKDVYSKMSFCRDLAILHQAMHSSLALVRI